MRAFLFQIRAENQNISLARKLSGVRTFFKYMVREGRLTANPALEVEPPRFPKKQPRFLMVDEAFALVELPDPETVIGLRRPGRPGTGLFLWPASRESWSESIWKIWI